MKGSLDFYTAITSSPRQLSDDKVDALMELFARVVSLEEKIATIVSIDPEAIRAEVLKDAADRAVEWYMGVFCVPENQCTRGLRAAILADEPKERDGAITWSSVEVSMLAAMMTGNLEKDTATLAMYLLDEPKEREAKHDNEDSFHITQAQAAEWHTQLVEEEEENKRLQAQRCELLEVVKYTRQVLPQDIWANDLRIMLDIAIANAEDRG